VGHECRHEHPGPRTTDRSAGSRAYRDEPFGGRSCGSTGVRGNCGHTRGKSCANVKRNRTSAAGATAQCRRNRGARRAAVRSGARDARRDNDDAGAARGCHSAELVGRGWATATRRAGAHRRSAPAHEVLPGSAERGRVDQAAAGTNSDGAGVALTYASQQSVRNASTSRFCLRAVCATVIKRSANRLPRSD
jgi:hypothetical protein